MTIPPATITNERSRSSAPWIVAAFLLFGATLAMRFPGVVMHESLVRYDPGASYSDWYPPIMARTWAWLNHLKPGTKPFFLIQMLLWWGGIGAISAALGRRQSHGAAALVLLVGVAPLWLGWATVILADAQLASCLVGTAGLVAHWRLDGRPVPRWATALGVLLITYASFLSISAPFATIIFALALFDWPRLPRLWSKWAAAAALIGAVLILGPILDNSVLRASHKGVADAIPLQDRAGDTLQARLASLPVHANSSLRLWVGPHQPQADPPADGPADIDALAMHPNPAGQGLIAAAHLMAISPLGWPICWLVVSAGLLWAGTGLGDPQSRLGRALALSACCMGISVPILSIASDLRYHLWPMVAAALALILLLDTRALDRRRSFIAGGILFAAIAIGTIARLGAAPAVPVSPPHLASPVPSPTG